MAKVLETLAERVRWAVEGTGLSQAEFARQAKIKSRTLQDVLGSQSMNPEMSTLQGISERSGVSIDELVFGNKRVSKSLSAIPPELRAAWKNAEKEEWRRAVALFFLTGEESYLDSPSIEDELRRRLLVALQFHGMKPKAPAPKR